MGRLIVAACLCAVMVLGLVAMPVAVVLSLEDGPLPADRLVRKKWLARTVLFSGGGASALAACGLYAIGRPGRRRDERGDGEGSA